jgi:hypothetical protein
MLNIFDMTNKFSKFNFNPFKLTSMEMPKPNIEFMNIKDPDEVTNKILTFIQAQSNIAQRQFNVSRNLIVATIIIMMFQIVIAGVGILESNTKQNNLTTVIETQSKQSEIISQMSLNLLDLQSQVHTLEKENGLLLKK